MERQNLIKDKELRKRQSKNRITTAVLKNNLTRKLAKEKMGITLIALVITIIVMIILAGITLNMALGENGLLSGASESAKNQRRTVTKTKLEIIVTNYVTNKTLDDSVTEEDLFDDIVRSDIVNGRDDITGSNGHYEVIDKEGDIYEIIIDEQGDVTVEFIGDTSSGGRIKVTQVTDKTISVQTSIYKPQGTYQYTYSYKKQSDTNYTEVQANSLDANYTYTNLKVETTYDIKVVVTDSKGKSFELTTTATTQTGEPTVLTATINPSATQPIVGTTITAEVTHNSNNTNIDITKCKWVYNNIETPIGTNEADYTGGTFSTNPQTIDLTANTVETYYLHVLTVDDEGNKKETVSSPILVSKLKPAEGATADVENVTFSTAYGKIDVIWLKDGTNEVTPTPNAPNLYNNGLTPVTWTYNETAKTWSEDSTAKSTWYNYSKASGTEDSKQSMWANAKNTDGSYFVWIPRYAYRITYYENDPTVETNKNQEPTGYYDGYGMWKADDNASLKCKLEDGIETVLYNGESYIVHPAFGTTKTVASEKQASLEVGGWDTPLTGFWIAKYEMSMGKNGTNTVTSNATIGNVATSSTVKAVSKPGVSSWRFINVANCYANSLNYDTSKKSHLIKNSEWGAVAYLTQSTYGRNGHEIDINNSTTFITGNGGGAIGGTATTKAGVTNAYNTQLGAKASTTGNIYGVYDMSGGVGEYTAIFNKNYSGDYFTNASYKSVSGSHFATTNGNSTQYATAYRNSTGDRTGSPTVYSVSKTGDGIKEVFNEGKGYNWNIDYSCVVTSVFPFKIRGGSCSTGVSTGVFYSNCETGDATVNYSFRVVLAQ